MEVIRRGNIPVIHITELLREQALDIFGQQTKKGTGVTDCANVVVMRTLGIGSVFSFDEVYRKLFGLQLAHELFPAGSGKASSDGGEIQGKEYDT